MKEYFSVNVSNYVEGKDFNVVRPASLSKPKDHAVMFVAKAYLESAPALFDVNECLVFWPETEQIPEEIQKKHAVRVCRNPHLEYCRFYKDNGITCYPQKEEFEVVDGAMIAKTAKIGNDVTIMPGTYIGGECVIGNHVYIGTGSKLLGETIVGDHVVIRENVIIGSDSLTTDRDADGSAVTMPQFGKVIIEEGAQIGTSTVINRGAIDETVIRRGAKISGSCYISHNVEIGENTFVVGETMILGSARIGRDCLISGNSTVNVKVSIGDGTTIGMGSVVTRDIPDHVIAYGTPAKVARQK